MIHHLRRSLLIGLLGASALGAACGDPFEPILTPIPEPRETSLVDFEQGDLIDPSAFDMFNGAAVRTDQTNGWDFLFVVDETLGPTLLPRNGLLDEESTAGLQLAEVPFAALEEAPESGYVMDEPVPVDVGDVLVVVSRRNPSVSVRCRVFGKLEVLSIEGSPAVATLDVVINPNCERRALVQEDEE